MLEWLKTVPVFIILAYAIQYFFGKNIKNIRIHILIVFWIFANVLDAHSTVLFVSRFGTEMEGNLIYRVLMEEFGIIQGLILVKGILVVLFSFLFFRLDNSTSNKIIFLTLSIAIFLIAISNYAHYFYIFPRTIGL